ncbi:MAG: YajQ family cyclic di-GMP-binding protein [Calditerrivibrio sp.]|nr:YajQ family cyclic di-GMP-binding protein [Calditerrivibrio sp.]MCA1932017.1 YajQ family cyclic di-GMP-binding protein [Calditerrivibrio sp.]MCA1979923.1 YajQ family cyclic di-GMP-binding protein [Calditerrivibrio sp.]
MADEHSFDIGCDVDFQEVSNAVNQAVKEMEQRFDFKGSASSIEFNKGDKEIILISDNEGKMKNVHEILLSKLVKRNISTKALIFGNIEKASGNTVRQKITFQQGIPQDKAKEIVKLIKDSKIKVTASIQEDKVRVKGKKLDDLQDVIKLVKSKDLGIEIQFTNYR